MTKNISETFVSCIKRLAGKKCWSIAAGEGTGSHVVIDFGSKILRNNPVKNEYLSEEQRKYTGEFSLYITCSWRLDSSDTVVCASKESNQNNGPMIRGLNKILNRKIVALDVLKPAYDLTVYFDKNLSLKLFCDETDTNDEFDNYSFFTPESIYTVTNRSGLNIETRQIL